MNGRDLLCPHRNVDHQFQRAGFDKKLFYLGRLQALQCSVPCHRRTYDSCDTVRQMVMHQWDLRIPELTRVAPYAVDMTMNLRVDGPLWGREADARPPPLLDAFVLSTHDKDCSTWSWCWRKHPRHHQVPLLAADLPRTCTRYVQLNMGGVIARASVRAVLMGDFRSSHGIKGSFPLSHRENKSCA